jgi:TfoX/Sxy family transcriptional regulator of competence genes
MSVKKEKSNHSEKTLEIYDKLIALLPGVERKGATMPYTSLNGNMFSFLNKDGKLGLRLPQQMRDEFLKKYKACLCMEHGAVMKEYISVPEKLFKNPGELKAWVVSSYEYARALKAKPTKKK